MLVWREAQHKLRRRAEMFRNGAYPVLARRPAIGVGKQQPFVFGRLDTKCKRIFFCIEERRGSIDVNHPQAVILACFLDQHVKSAVV